MQLSKSSRISCNAHDYVEIVCMRSSKVQINLYGGDTLVGLAEDIVRTGDSEAIQLRTISGRVLVDLANIETLVAQGNSVKEHNFTIKLGAV